jgi:plasmid stability protein
MPSLTIKNIPNELLDRLRAQAASKRRSLNSEVIACLETVAQATPIDSEALLARTRAVRQKPAHLRLTDRTLKRLKSEGRP